jgi:hypothetical protein
MKAKKTRGQQTKTQSSVRASISFPPDVFETLGLIAEGKKVSLAWVVREGAENYIADKRPLFVKPGH